jgi:peptidoglycan hydrolase-like protein with peptidoglycan-binding domain
MSLQNGSQGKAVADVQTALGRHGLTVTDRPGVFGASTEKAVMTFRANHGMSEIGVVDEATWHALGLPGSVPRPVRFD